jgi:hypothetical protein
MIGSALSRQRILKGKTMINLIARGPEHGWGIVKLD